MNVEQIDNPMNVMIDLFLFISHKGAQIVPLSHAVMKIRNHGHVDVHAFLFLLLSYEYFIFYHTIGQLD